MDGEPKKSNGKGNRGRLIAERLLVLRNYFYERASEGKGASWKEVSAYLKSQNPNYVIDRKTFYRDCISLMSIFNLDLEHNATDKKWYMKNPVFTERELQTTINCIKSAPFLPEDEASALARKLNALTCLDKVKTLSQNLQLGCVEEAYANIRDNLKIILAAIEFHRCISFQYIVYPNLHEISACTTKEIDEHGKPKFYDESGSALHRYCNSGVCSPIYVERRSDGYFLHLLERDAVSGETAKRFINIAEMENIAILPDERFHEEPDNIPWDAMPRKKETAVVLEAKLECLDTVQTFFEGAEIELRHDFFVAEVLVESVLDLIPCMLMCGDTMMIISPPEVVSSLERIACLIKDSVYLS